MRIYFREYIIKAVISISFHHLITFIFATIDDASVAFHILKDVVYKGYRYVEEKFKTRKQSNQTKLKDAKEKKADSKTEEET